MRINQQESYVAVKRLLFEQCSQYVTLRIQTARQAMEAAQESANSESKSSAGDKYETGRAMAQLDRDRHAQQLAEAQGVERQLARIQVDQVHSSAQPGSLVITSRGTFYISISAGKLLVDGQSYFAVSPASPLATALAGRRAGDTVMFNNQPFEVLMVA